MKKYRIIYWMFCKYDNLIRNLTTRVSSKYKLLCTITIRTANKSNNVNN